MRYKMYLALICLFLSGCGVEYQFKTAERLKNERKYPEAITKYRKVIEKYPATEYASTSQFSIANIYFYKLKNYQQAKIEYQIFLKNHPSDSRANKVNNEITRIDEIANLLQKAQEDLKNRQIKDAIEGFGKVLELDADCPEAKQGLEQARQEEIIEVKSGKIFLCEDCGKVIKKDIKIVSVKRKDSSNYKVLEVREGLCNECKMKKAERDALDLIKNARSRCNVCGAVSKYTYEQLLGRMTNQPIIWTTTLKGGNIIVKHYIEQSGYGGLIGAIEKDMAEGEFVVSAKTGRIIEVRKDPFNLGAFVPPCEYCHYPHQPSPFYKK